MKNKKELWFDARSLKKAEQEKMLPVVFNQGFSGVMVNLGAGEIIKKWPKGIKILYCIDKNDITELIKEINKFDKDRQVIIFAKDKEVLASEALLNIEKGIFSRVDDKDSMEKVIESTSKFPNCIIEFSSTTNIPLELILAFSQKNNSKVCKVVNCANDGWIAIMTMEIGSNSVLLQTKNINDIIIIKEKFENLESKEIKLEELKVLDIKHVGMGDRVCIDTISKLNKDEGILIGSTSSGGILVSSETHFLPYMDLRPFRVNAGAIHSYVWCDDNYTKYLSELKAGDEVLAVNSQGKTRKVVVGRIKMEKRPMLLINVQTQKKDTLNVIVQDDWHIRIISKNGEIKNSTSLKANDIILGYPTEPGRHIGVKIDETIIEK